MTEEMTYEGCKGHEGYLVSMQFLGQRQDLKSFPAVGYWVCVPQEKCDSSRMPNTRSLFEGTICHISGIVSRPNLPTV